ncbi:hypothetical protein BDZ89DRAFT_1141426 [Hymenopellis radicata]|nr:hypothetical protein BDZ89DRAFT_1141426 [Hymenopellis radicata]
MSFNPLDLLAGCAADELNTRKDGDHNPLPRDHGPDNMTLQEYSPPSAMYDDEYRTAPPRQKKSQNFAGMGVFRLDTPSKPPQPSRPASHIPALASPPSANPVTPRAGPMPGIPVYTPIHPPPHMMYTLPPSFSPSVQSYSPTPSRAHPPPRDRSVTPPLSAPTLSSKREASRSPQKKRDPKRNKSQKQAEKDTKVAKELMDLDPTAAEFGHH